MCSTCARGARDRHVTGPAPWVRIARAREAPAGLVLSQCTVQRNARSNGTRFSRVALRHAPTSITYNSHHSPSNGCKMPRKRATGLVEPTYTESNLLNALNAVKSGSSIRQAARDWGIPLTTLHGRIVGRVSRREANEHTQRLSPT